MAGVALLNSLDVMFKPTVGGDSCVDHFGSSGYTDASGNGELYDAQGGQDARDHDNLEGFDHIAANERIQRTL